MYSEFRLCRHCGRRLKRPRISLGATGNFIFSRHTRCIQCGTHNVYRLAKRDRIDWMSKNPVSWLFRLIGAPLVKCPACRLQFYDWRSVKPAAPRTLRSDPTSGAPASQL